MCVCSVLLCLCVFGTVNGHIKRGLTLLGATAVGDKLQVRVCILCVCVCVACVCHVHCVFERGLTLLVATAVEDKLQVRWVAVESL